MIHEGPDQLTHCALSSQRTDIRLLVVLLTGHVALNQHVNVMKNHN